jgi:UDP-glucose 4-epimerase
VRTLVIGCGFIGSNVATRLAAGGRPPLVLTRRPPADEVVEAIGAENLRLGNAADVGTVEAALEGVDRVAFCAGGLLPSASEREPHRDRELTLGPVEATLEALHKRPGATLTYLSSGGTVYGDLGEGRPPADENAPTNPQSTYGENHLLCEQKIETARTESGLDARILRCSTVYGEYQKPGRGQGVVNTFLDLITHDEPVALYGGGTAIRDYIYVGDVAAAMIALMSLEEAPPVVNVGSGEETSVVKVLDLVEAELGCLAERVEEDKQDGEVGRIVLDTSLLHAAIDLEITPLPEGIARTHRWLTAADRGSA